MDLTAADPNAEKAILQRGIVITVEIALQTSFSITRTWNPARPTALGNG